MAALVVGCLTPAAASAVIGPIGSSLTLPYQIGFCNNNCLATQTQQAGGELPNPINAPGNGKILSFAVRTGDPDAIYTLIILRPTGTLNGFSAVTRSPAQAPVPAGTTDNIIIYPLATPLPIRQGDGIGLLQTGNADEGLPHNAIGGGTANVMSFLGTGNTLLDGGAALFTADPNQHLLLQATLDYCKVPDVAKLKTKAAREAVAAGGCTPVVKKKKTKKKKKVGKVTKQDPAPGLGATDGSTNVTITVGKKR